MKEKNAARISYGCGGLVHPYATIVYRQPAPLISHGEKSTSNYNHTETTDCQRYIVIL